MARPRSFEGSQGKGALTTVLADQWMHVEPPIAPRQDGFVHQRKVCGEMLELVEHEQDVALGEVQQQLLPDRVRRRLQPERIGQSGVHLRGVT